MPGWDTVAGWIFDRFPTKREGILDGINTMEDKRNELQKKWNTIKATDDELALYDRLGKRLREYEKKLRTLKT